MPNTQAVGIAYSDPEFTTCYASQEIGYSAAAQGTVTQATDKSTAVTLNKSAGRITMNNAALAGSTAVSFTLTTALFPPMTQSLCVFLVLLLAAAQGRTPVMFPT